MSTWFAQQQPYQSTAYLQSQPQRAGLVSNTGGGAHYWGTAQLTGGVNFSSFDPRSHPQGLVNQGQVFNTSIPPPPSSIRESNLPHGTTSSVISVRGSSGPSLTPSRTSRKTHISKATNTKVEPVQSKVSTTHHRSLSSTVKASEKKEHTRTASSTSKRKEAHGTGGQSHHGTASGSSSKQADIKAKTVHFHVHM